MRSRLAVASGFLLVGSLLLPSPFWADEPPKLALVKQVFDGNSMLLSTGLRIGYAGIRAPSLNATGGREAREFSRRMVEGRKVRLEPAARLLGPEGEALFYVFLENGAFVNAEMVGEGMARAHIVPPNDRFKDLLVRMEALAKKHRRGIWGESPRRPSSPELPRGRPPGFDLFTR